MICPKNKGFSLIELLLTLTIILILVAIAIPSFNKLFQNAKVRTDIVTAAKISQAVRMWKYDNDSRMVPLTPTKYFELEGIDKYIGLTYKPSSYVNAPADYYVCNINDGEGEKTKVIVGISPDPSNIQFAEGDTVDDLALYTDGEAAGWCYFEDEQI
jgi:prepilin-type N-terminal cleavage/methylation domain-containing protein